MYRMWIGLNYCHQAKVKGLDHLNYFEIYIILLALLIGGIEPNPGPSSNSSSPGPTFEDTSIRSNFSIVHYNIQSLANKLDLTESELRNFDVLCLTETWLDRRISDETIKINGINLYRRDRADDNHGGICVYINQSIFSCRRSDLELPQLECVWVEISLHNRKELLGTFYRPPNSNNLVYTSIEDSIGLAFDTNVPNITITGDFNLDVSKHASYRKINDLYQHFNLEQIITEPTHYTENSDSIIDLFLVSNKNRVLLSGVGEPFLDQNIRYHCPIYCVYNFDKIITPSFTRHIYLYHLADYQTLSHELTETDWSSLKDNDIDTYAQNVTDRVFHLVNTYSINLCIFVNMILRG